MQYRFRRAAASRPTRTTRLYLEGLEARHAMTAVVDLNGDGRQDVLTAFEWYEGNGQGTFTLHELHSVTARIIDHGDLDGDGDVDLLTRETNLPTVEIRWLENRQGDFSTAHRLRASDASVTELLDLDGDGDKDIVDGRWEITYPDGIFTRTETVRIWTNDGTGNFAAPAPIDLAAMPGEHRFADWDHDGPLNSIALQHGPMLQDGDRYFFKFDVVSKEYGSADTQFLKSFDVVIDPTYPGPFLSEYADQPMSVSWSDVNGDGESDFVVTWMLGVFSQVEVKWYQGNGQGQFDDGHKLLSYSNEATYIDWTLQDVDGDLDQDLLARTTITGPIYTKSSVMINTGQSFEPGSQYNGFAGTIGRLNGDAMLDLVFADVTDDVDFWVDRVTGVRHDFVLLSKAQQIFYAQSAARNAVDVNVLPFYAPYDKDGDRQVTRTDVDLLLFELVIPKGDSNLNGIFNSSDLLLVFQAGGYEDEVAGNARWETGDWNGDGEFNSSDLVFVFQSGMYLG